MNQNDRLIILSSEIARRDKLSKFQTWRKFWHKKAKSERIILWIMFGLFVIYSFTFIYPIFWALYNSFKQTKVFNKDQFSLPTVWTLDNYKNIFLGNGDLEIVSIFSSLWNSIWMSTLSTVLGLAASAITAYVVSKYKFKASGFIYGLVIFIQVIPIVGGVSGMYNLLWNTLKIADKPLLIWPIWFGGFGFSFLMLYSAFKSVPWSYAESSFIDGAGHFRTFFTIMLPTVKPVLSSLFVVNFIGAWNDYMTSYLYIPSYSPLAYTIIEQQQKMASSVPAYLALIIVSIIPTIVLFISFQKTIMENTTTGGLKG